jgi:cadmium resistance protein CadD (predicted permease)
MFCEIIYQLSAPLVRLLEITPLTMRKLHFIVNILFLVYMYHLLTKTETKTEPLRSWFYFIISPLLVVMAEYIAKGDNRFHNLMSASN